MKKIIKWVKVLLKIVRNYDGDQITITQYMNTVRELTTINVDVHTYNKSPCNVVMVGRYRNTDYVEIFSVRPDDFSNFIEMFRDWRKQGRIDRIDCPPQMKAVFEREKF